MAHPRSTGGAPDGRIRLVRLLIVVAFVAIAGRAMALTATSSGLAAAADSQQQRTIEVRAHRGQIVDRTGEVLAAAKEMRTVWATPREIKDPVDAATRLAKLLKVPRKPLLRALSDRGSWYAVVARGVEPALAQRALDLGIVGVGASAEEGRDYPKRSVAAQVVGFVGTEGKGLAGLEYQYDEVLAGTPGKELVVKDPAGRALKTERLVAPQAGKTIRLTLDQYIQAEAERALVDAVRHYKAKAAVAIVLDPKTGEILAMANAPLINANAFGKRPEYQRNRAVTDSFEPGSIFKVLTVSAALEEDLVTPSKSFVLPYRLKVGDKWIRESHPRGTQRFTVRQILAQSSNVGAAVLGKMLGEEKLKTWIQRFGFVARTGLDFPGEVAGLMPGFWSMATTGNVPMGQGISVTPIQIAAAYAAVANDGVWLKPHLVAQIGETAVNPSGARRVLSSEVSRQVLGMMNDAVMEGTGTAFQISGYKAAGKTGTAQKADLQRGGYAAGRYVASFVGVVPSDDPRLVVLVAVDEPSGAIYGGAVAAPTAKRIAEFALQHLKIAPP